MLLADYYREVFTLRFPRGHLDWRWLPKSASTERKPWHIGWYFAGWPLSKVNQPDVPEAWWRAMRDAGASKATIWRAHALLVQIINHAVEKDYLAGNRLSTKPPKYRLRSSRSCRARSKRSSRPPAARIPSAACWSAWRRSRTLVIGSASGVPVPTTPRRDAGGLSRLCRSATRRGAGARVAANPQRGQDRHRASGEDRQHHYGDGGGRRRRRNEDRQ